MLPLPERAEEAGLHYGTDAVPGITRIRSGRGFRYLNSDGKPLKDAKTLERIRSLVIPPAYRDVWISPDPLSHLQYTALDDRGRKQYRYHPRWNELRDETKYGKMADFGKALQRIRKRVHADLARPGLSREKVLAAIVHFLDKAHIRVGNEEYAKENGSYGLTTLKNDHVEAGSSRIRFHFPGKSGVYHKIELHDPRLSRIVKKLQDLPGQDLFQYVDGDTVHSITSSDVNAYIKEISGKDFTAKDFRTWAGTVLAFERLASEERPDTDTARKKQVVEMVKSVSRELGNTPSVCRKCYIHPLVLSAYEEGAFATKEAEKAVVSLLEKAA